MGVWWAGGLEVGMHGVHDIVVRYSSDTRMCAYARAHTHILRIHSKHYAIPHTHTHTMYMYMYMYMYIYMYIYI